MILPTRSLIGFVLVGITQAQWEFPRADATSAGISAQHLQQASKDLHALVDSGKLAGATYAIMRDGKVVAMESMGYQDLERGIPMSEQTIFRVFSQSKPVGTAGFLTLIDEGRIGLDDPVSKYIPEFADLRVQSPNGFGTMPLERPMTIRHLLTHTSGLTYGFMDNTPCDQNYNKNNILNPQESMEQKVKRVAKIPLCSQPGSKWQYGISTDVLAYIASEVTGLSINEFYEQRLFGPLRMKDTGFWVPGDKASRLATVYQTDGQKLSRPAPDPNNVQLVDYTKPPKYLAAGGGFVSTLGDYMRFGQMLLNKGELDGNRILRPETVEAMTIGQLSPNLLPLVYNPNVIIRDMTFGWGIGVGIPHNEYNNYPRPGEFTWGGGMSTNFWVSPNDRTVIVLMTQIIPFTNAPKRAIRDWTYMGIDAYDNEEQETAVKEALIDVHQNLRGGMP